MFLNNRWIDIYCKQGMVVPYEPSLVNPASLDIRIGDTAKLRSLSILRDDVVLGSVVDGSVCWQDIDLSATSFESPYLLLPGQLMLVATLEKFYIPDELLAIAFLKSSRARELIEHLHAALVDPGYYGSVLTLKLKNEDYEPKKIYYGLPIGQLVFGQLVEPADPSYKEAGSYNYAQTVQSSNKEFHTTP